MGRVTDFWGASMNRTFPRDAIDADEAFEMLCDHSQ